MDYIDESYTELDAQIDEIRQQVIVSTKLLDDFMERSEKFFRYIKKLGKRVEALEQNQNIATNGGDFANDYVG